MYITQEKYFKNIIEKCNAGSNSIHSFNTQIMLSKWRLEEFIQAHADRCSRTEIRLYKLTDIHTCTRHTRKRQEWKAKDTYLTVVRLSFFFFLSHMCMFLVQQEPWNNNICFFTKYGGAISVGRREKTWTPYTGEPNERAQKLKE